MRTEGDCVWLDPDFILEQVAKAPRNVRRAGAQSGQQRAHRRRPHGLLVGLRAAVRAPGRRAPRRDDGRLPQLREARALVPRARHDRRHDRRAQRHAARLAPPRHGAGAADALGQGLHGLGDVGPERGRHDPHDRDPVRRPRGDRADARRDLADQRQLAAALRRSHAGRDVRVQPRQPAGASSRRSC